MELRILARKITHAMYHATGLQADEEAIFEMLELDIKKE